MRSSNPAQQLKEQKLRTTGITPAFQIKQGGQGLDAPLILFRQVLGETATRHGMISVTYLPDPANPNQMVCILHAHSKFTLDSARLAIARIKPKWDSYDLNNNRDLLQLLFNSLDNRSEKLL